MTLKHREERSLYQPDHSRTKLVVCDVQMIEHHSFLQWAFNWQSPFQKKPALGFTLNTSQHNAGSVEKANYFNIYQVQITKPINCQKKKICIPKFIFSYLYCLLNLKVSLKCCRYLRNIMWRILCCSCRSFALKCFRYIFSLNKAFLLFPFSLPFSYSSKFWFVWTCRRIGSQGAVSKPSHPQRSHSCSTTMPVTRFSILSQVCLYPLAIKGQSKTSWKQPLNLYMSTIKQN